MKTKLRKVLNLVLCLCLCLSLSSEVWADGTSGWSVPEKLQSVLAKYPDGSFWNSSFDGGSQCYGFAKLIVYELFGKYSDSRYRSWTYNGTSTSGMQKIGEVDNCTTESVQGLLQKAMPGDVLQFDTGNTSGHQHSMIIYSISQNGAEIYECNWYKTGGDNRVSKTSLTSSEIASRQTRSDGTKRGKLSLLHSDNYPTVSPYVQEYLDQCSSVSCNVILTVTTAGNMKNMPCSVDTNSQSETVEKLTVGDTYSSTTCWVNTQGSTWYEVTSTAGERGFIYSGDVSVSNPNSYTISYNANGGSGAPASQTKTQGQALTLSTTKPTRSSVSAGSYTITLNANGGSVSTSSLTAARTTKYTFKNWNTASGGGGTSYASGGTYSSDASATLYAQWNSSTTTASVTLPTPTRDGYTFKGWGTSSNASSGSTGSYTPSGNVTLYAVWEVNKLGMQYNSNGGIVGTNENNFTQDANGNILRSGNATVSTWQYGETYENGLINDTTFALSRSGYTFKGWRVGTDASATIYNQDISLKPETICPELKNKSTSVKLYAVWEANKYTITYNANGGTGAPANQTKTHGTALTLSSTKPTRADASAGSYTVTLNANGGTVSSTSLTAARTTKYTFKNWNTAQNDGGTSYNSGASYNMNASATLYAQWDSIISTTAVTLPTPTHEGWVFMGWAESNSATNGVTGSYIPSGNVTLYAVWEANKYTITYNANGGSGAPDSQPKIHGTALTLSSTKPTRADASAGSYTVTLTANGGTCSSTSLTAARTTKYTFKNWNTEQNGSGTNYNSGASYTMNASATLYAQWDSITSTAAVTLPTPTHEGWVFMGWAESSSATNGVTGSYTPSDNVTLCAVWLKPDFILPASLTAIADEAFAGGAFTYVKLSENTDFIGKNAFANCPNLGYIEIPRVNVEIDGAAFGTCTELTIFGKAGGNVESFAQAHGFTFVAVE